MRIGSGNGLTDLAPPGGEMNAGMALGTVPPTQGSTVKLSVAVWRTSV